MNPVVLDQIVRQQEEIESLRQQLTEWETRLAAALVSLSVSSQQLTSLKNELKDINKAIDDPRTDLTMTMSEIIVEQKQQLAAALAAIKVKDAALQSAISAHKYESGDLHDALAIHPDDMKEVKMECFLAGGELRWRDESLSVLREWIRQPQHDLIAKVPK